MIVLLQITSGAFLGWLLRASFEASLVAVLVVLAQFALRKRVSARWRYNLWLLVLARLALPVFPESRLSPFNWLKLHHDPASTSSWVIQNHDTNPLPGDVIKPQTKASSPTTDRTARLVEMAEPPSVNVKERLNQIEFQEAQQAPNQMAMPRHAAPSRSVHRTSAASGIAEVQPRLGVTKFWVRINWKFYLWTIWCAGASLFALWAIITTLRLAWMIRGYRRIDDPALYAILAGCCRQVGVRRVPVVLESPGHLGPSLVGYFRPRLMVPRSALEMLKPNELRLVLLHELVHLKRGDVAWNWVLTVLQALHWFNPVIWGAFARLRADRELACDEAVLNMGAPIANADDQRDYGRAILKLLETFSGGTAPPGLVGVLDGGRTMRNALMRRRITMIAQLHRSGSRWSVIGISLSLAVGAVALTGAVKGQQVQEDGPNPAAAGAGIVQRAGSAAAPATQPASPAGAANAPRDAAYAAGAGPAVPGRMGGGFAGGTGFGRVGNENGPPAGVGGAGGGGIGAAPGSPPPVGRFGRSAPPAVAPMGGMPGMGGGLMDPRGAAGGPQPTHSLLNAHVEDPEAARADARTAEKLRKPLVASFDGVDLADVIQFFADQTNADIFMDTRALENTALIGVKVQIKQPLPADELLRLILRSAGGDELGYAIAHGVVVITTSEQLERSLVTRGYDISDIQDPDSLIKAIVDMISPDSWQDRGGSSGSIRIIGPKMLVTNTDPRQREVAKLLALLRDTGQAGNQPKASATANDAKIQQLRNELVRYSQQLTDCNQQYDEARLTKGELHPQVQLLKHRLESLKAGRDQTVKALSELEASTPSSDASQSDRTREIRVLPGDFSITVPAELEEQVQRAWDTEYAKKVVFIHDHPVNARNVFHQFQANVQHMIDEYHKRQQESGQKANS